tara:strand:- start:132 stop:464 length:333 start_codon:yes stop_codon:yes gene_type:complete
MDFFWKLPIIKDIDTEQFLINTNEIDFEGQKYCEDLYKKIIIFSVILAMIVSFSTQYLSHGIYIISAGTALAMIVCVPAWGIYKRNPLKWLPYYKPVEIFTAEELKEKSS